ncbi:MAG TPA: hypothetical protein DDX98_01765 [Bacteroidales bacterium]|jgi:tetratricopeptide (TPR) repeat protein|nr:hypothetical protein [Bacteroidales bacterium]
MEILRMLALAVILSITTLFGYSQVLDKTIEAFQNSYLHEASGNLSDAILDLKNVYDENTYEINLRLGWLTYSSGLFNESHAYYSLAIKQKPYAIEPRFGIVLPQAALGNWSSVISQYEKILEIAPNNSIALHRLGLIYYGQKDYLTAESYFEKVVNLYPFDYDALVMFAWTNYQLKKYRQAKVLFTKALMNTPTGSSAMEGIKLMEQ